MDSLEEAIAAAERAGGEAVTEIIDVTGVGRWMQIREPGGNIFGLMQGYHADQPGGQPEGENPGAGGYSSRDDSRRALSMYSSTISYTTCAAGLDSFSDPTTCPT